MNGPPQDEGRPPARERPQNVVSTDHQSVADETRCIRCHAPLTAPKSVRRLLVCHRRASEDVLSTFCALVERVSA